MSGEAIDFLIRVGWGKTVIGAKGITWNIFLLLILVLNILVPETSHIDAFFCAIPLDAARCTYGEQYLLTVLGGLNCNI